MIDFPYIEEISQSNKSKVVLLVVDGLGGLPDPNTGMTELETAYTPNLDQLVTESAGGLTTPVLPGITPGSGPGHLALFGYDPVKYYIGRGVLEALGMGINLGKEDIAARGNFCTLDSEGNIADRRAGRIPTEQSILLCQKLNGIDIDGFEVNVEPVRDHRFVLILRGNGLSDRLAQTDPEQLGVPPLVTKALTDSATTTANAVNHFLSAARELLKDELLGNMVLLRGFSKLPDMPSMSQRYKLRPAGIAAYPMYRGLASLCGMEIIDTGETFKEEVETLTQSYDGHDFFFIHYKPADAAGEDGDFDEKVKALEALDVELPNIVKLNPEVLVIAGDHSAPAVLAGHSWHPVPFILRSMYCRPDDMKRLTERECMVGSFGQLPATSLMFLALGHAGKLAKYGP